MRTLDDGRSFVVWKVLFAPEELRAATEALGWDLEVRPTGSYFLYASGTRPRQAPEPSGPSFPDELSSSTSR